MEHIENILIDIDTKKLQENIELHEGFLSAIKKLGKNVSTAGKYVSGVLHHKKIDDITKEIYADKMKSIKDLDTSEKQLYSDIEFLLSTLSYIKTKDNRSYDIEHPQKAVEEFEVDYKHNNFEDDNAEYAECLDDILSSKLRRKIMKLDNDELVQYHANGKSVYDYLADLQNKGSVPKFIQKFGRKGSDAADLMIIKAAILLLKRIYQDTCTGPAKQENENLIYDRSTYTSTITRDLQRLISSKVNSSNIYKTNDGKSLTFKQLVKDYLANKAGWNGIDLSKYSSDEIIEIIAKYKKYFVNNLIWVDSKAFGNYFMYVLDKIDNANDVVEFKKAALEYFVCTTTEIINDAFARSNKPDNKDPGMKDDYAIRREISKIYSQLYQGQSFDAVLPKLKDILNLQPAGLVKGGYYNQILATMVDELMVLEGISDSSYSKESKDSNVDKMDL